MTGGDVPFPFIPNTHERLLFFSLTCDILHLVCSFSYLFVTSTMVVQQLKALLLSILRLFRRMLCCFSFGRRRKPSLSEPMEIKVVVNDNRCYPNGIAADASPYSVPKPESQYQYQGRQQQQPERDWNSWDDSPRSVSEHIEQYRQRIAKPPTPPPEEPEPDFFSELTPVIKPQIRYYLGDDKKTKADFSRLEAKVDVPIAMNADLEDWEDDSINGGWEELDSEQTKQMIREKRKELRLQRNQKLAKSSGVCAQNACDKGDTHTSAVIASTNAPQYNFRSYT